MSHVETAIRGGAIALLLLLAVLSLRPANRSPVHLLSGLFALSAAAFTLTSMPELAYRHVLWLLPFRLVSAGTSTVFWLWSRAIFDDEFRPSWRHLAIWLAMLALAFGCFTQSEPNSTWRSTSCRSASSRSVFGRRCPAAAPIWSKGGGACGRCWR